MLGISDFQPLVILGLTLLCIWQAARPQRSKVTLRDNQQRAQYEALSYLHLQVDRNGVPVDLLFTQSEFDIGVSRAVRQPEDL